jgi:hypothetical protein
MVGKSADAGGANIVRLCQMLLSVAKFDLDPVARSCPVPVQRRLTG